MGKMNFQRIFGFDPVNYDDWHEVAVAEFDKLTIDFGFANQWVIKQAALNLGIWFQFKKHLYQIVAENISNQARVQYFQKQAQIALQNYTHHLQFLAQSPQKLKSAELDPIARLNALANDRPEFRQN